MSLETGMVCFVYVKSENEIGLIKYGETGYYRTDYEPLQTVEDNERFVKWLNDGLALTDNEIYAMEIGSMFGWDAPGANPDFYKGANHE